MIALRLNGINLNKYYFSAKYGTMKKSLSYSAMINRV